MKHEPLQPLPYHRALAAHFRTHHPAVWDSFHAAQKSGSKRADVELFLLKSSYRLSEQDHPDLHACVAKARDVLGVTQPIALYQSHKGHADNASMAYTGEMGHLRFEGEILSNLIPEEIEALIGHEVGHYKLWAEADGDFLTSARILDAMAAERDVHPSLIESQRLHHLYTEIYCDRAGALVAGRFEPMVSVLVKLDTGDVRVSPEHYVAQAEEIFKKSAGETSQGTTHPEHFIRARAVARWCRDSPEAPSVDPLVAEMIEGRRPLDSLDVLGRARLTRWSRGVVHHLAQLVKPAKDSAWERHRQRFQPLETERAVNPAEPVDFKALRDALAVQAGTIRDYFVYLLLDFAVIDPERREAFRRCREVAGELGLANRFEELASEHLASAALAA